MKSVLYEIVGMIARIHELILTLNDANTVTLSDKQLHFIIIGVVGMLLVFVIHPIFLYLAKKKHVLVISWIYVITVLIVLTFAIEIGQAATHTGTMEFADIMSGLLGFIVMFGIFLVLRGIIRLISHLLRGKNAGGDDSR